MSDFEDPNASDESIAATAADYLLESLSRRKQFFRLFIMHDVRAKTLRRLERLRKFNSDYQLEHTVGPCLLPYDWSLKNIVGISTRDPDRARRWIVEAMLAGYGVFRSFSRQDGGYRRGSITDIRVRRREEIES